MNGHISLEGIPDKVVAEISGVETMQDALSLRRKYTSRGNHKIVDAIDSRIENIKCKI